MGRGGLPRMQSAGTADQPPFRVAAGGAGWRTAGWPAKGPAWAEQGVGGLRAIMTAFGSAFLLRRDPLSAHRRHRRHRPADRWLGHGRPEGVAGAGLAALTHTCRRALGRAVRTLEVTLGGALPAVQQLSSSPPATSSGPTAGLQPASSSLQQASSSLQPVCCSLQPGLQRASRGQAYAETALLCELGL